MSLSAYRAYRDIIVLVVHGRLFNGGITEKLMNELPEWVNFYITPYKTFFVTLVRTISPKQF